MECIGATAVAEIEGPEVVEMTAFGRTYRLEVTRRTYGGGGTLADEPMTVEDVTVRCDGAFINGYMRVVTDGT